MFAILTGLSWVLFVIGSVMFPGGEPSLQLYLTQATSPALLMYNWGGTLGALLAIPVFLTFYVGFRKESGSVLMVPVVFSLVGSVFLAMGFMLDSGSHIYLFGPAMASASGAEAEAFLQAARFAQDSIEVTWSVGSFMAYGAPVIWMAILMLRSDRAPRWMNWAGIVAGLASFIWLGRFVPIPVPQTVGLLLLLVSIVAALVWMIGVTWRLSRIAGEE